MAHKSSTGRTVKSKTVMNTNEMMNDALTLHLRRCFISGCFTKPVHLLSAAVPAATSPRWAARAFANTKLSLTTVSALCESRSAAAPAALFLGCSSDLHISLPLS